MSLEVPAGGEMGQSEVVKMKLSAKLRMMSIMSEVPPVPLGRHERRSGAQKKDQARDRHAASHPGSHRQPAASACTLLRKSAHRRISL